MGALHFPAFTVLLFAPRDTSSRILAKYVPVVGKPACTAVWSLSVRSEVYGDRLGWMGRILRFAPLLALVLAVSVACGSSGSTTSTPGPVSTRAAVATAPAGQSATSPAAPVAALRTAVPGKLGTLADLATTQQAPDFQALPGAKASFGKLGDAVFQIEVPTAWNGDLVMYAHGFAGFGTTVSVEPPPRALREQLVSQGYAWAASSFSQNGYTPGIGADDTLALKLYFEQQFSKAKRV